MEEFHRIRRLPPYVFEQVNRAKWPARSSLTDYPQAFVYDLFRKVCNFSESCAIRRWPARLRAAPALGA